jgi:HAMP domain-containing protein
LFAVLLAAPAIGIFDRLLVLFLRPLRQLVRDAQRRADGDLDEPVEVRRLDEIGLVGGSLERVTPAGRRHR